MNEDMVEHIRLARIAIEWNKSRILRVLKTQSNMTDDYGIKILDGIIERHLDNIDKIEEEIVHICGGESTTETILQ